jgi:6-pyruvoyl-tetrahydropterin synthase
MAMTAVTQRFTFRSVHSLNSGTLRERCHGHQFHLEVSVAPLAAGDLAATVESQVLRQLDGRNLNGLLPEATGETLVEWIQQCLEQTELAPHLLAVALQETRKNRFVSARSDLRWI